MSARFACCSLISTLCLVAIGLGSAAAQPAPREDFSANRFTPAAGPSNYGMVDGALVAGHLTPSAGLMIDYAHRPFVLFQAECTGEGTDDCKLEGFERNIVAYQVTGNVMGSITFGQRIQLGLVVPVVGTSGDGYHASRGTPGAPPIRILGGDAFALGDPRLSAKVKILGEGSTGMLLAGVVYATAPVGKAMAEGRGLGHDGPTAGGHLAAEYRGAAFRAAVNVGGTYRPERVLLSTASGSELTYGAAAAFDLTSLVAISGEVTGASRLSNQLDENPLEMRVYGHLAQGDLTFTLGGGAGLLGGVGIPNFRIIAGAQFAPEGLDSDGDGVRDSDDKCPGEPEDFDGYLDDDGCPEIDNDADGIPDGTDRCPDEAEDNDGTDDQDGCPDRDNDGDGIQDGYDSCPEEAEDMDGDRDEDGCPDNDRDRDGVPDDTDQCPDTAEDTDGFGDDDGCPETDFDGDGISDEEDQCPDEIEDADGFEDEDGCPEEGEPEVQTRTRGRR